MICGREGEIMFMYHKFPMYTKHMFFNPTAEIGHMFKFSSDLEKIGIEWDVAVENGTYVEVISDPIEITRPKYGTMTVVKIKADIATDYHTIVREFWVPTMCVYKVEKNETSGIEQSN